MLIWRVSFCNRTLFVSFEGLDGKKGQNCFVSKITLCIPNYGNIETQGEPRSDKKSSYDSAAIPMLIELQKLGKLKIGTGDFGDSLDERATGVEDLVPMETEAVVTRVWNQFEDHGSH